MESRENSILGAHPHRTQSRKQSFENEIKPYADSRGLNNSRKIIVGLDGASSLQDRQNNRQLEPGQKMQNLEGGFKIVGNQRSETPNTHLSNLVYTKHEQSAPKIHGTALDQSGEDAELRALTRPGAKDSSSREIPQKSSDYQMTAQEYDIKLKNTLKFDEFARNRNLIRHKQPSQQGFLLAGSGRKIDPNRTLNDG